MTAIDPAEARTHLERLLASEQLGKSESGRKLLTYLFERSLREDTPKETEIAFDVFGKDASFNGAEDSVVRVGVRTLRQKLMEYYAGSGSSDQVQFAIPKGGYPGCHLSQTTTPLQPQNPLRGMSPPSDLSLSVGADAYSAAKSGGGLPSPWTKGSVTSAAGGSDRPDVGWGPRSDIADRFRVVESALLEHGPHRDGRCGDPAESAKVRSGRTW